MSKPEDEFDYIRPLPDSYRVPGVREIPMIKKGEHVVVYGSDDPYPLYEVFRIKIGKPAVVKGVEVPARYKTPSAESFGVWAWTCGSLETAMKRFEEKEAKYAAIASGEVEEEPEDA